VSKNKEPEKTCYKKGKKLLERKGKVSKIQSAQKKGEKGQERKKGESDQEAKS
jgi:hypothetical protein